MSVSKNILKYLADHNMHYQTFEHQNSTKALLDAHTIHCSENQMAKVVVCKVDRKNAMFVLPSNELIHLGTLKDELGIKKVKWLKEDKLKEIFSDCDIGAMPIFGDLYNIPVFCSDHFDINKDIYFNAGTHTDAVKIPMQEFIDVTHPKQGRFSVSIEEYEDYKINYGY